MTHGIILTNDEHLLESMEAGSKNEVVIRVAKNPKEISIDPASKLTPPKNLKEIIHIDTVEDSTENSPLSHPIPHGEDVRESSSPSHIGILVEVDEDQLSDKDQGKASRYDFLEHNTVPHKVECLGHVHQAGVHLRPIPKEVADGLHCCPCAHCG